MSEVKKLIEERGEICLSEIYGLISGERGLIDHALMQLAGKGVISESFTEARCRGCPMKCSVQGEKVYRLS